MRRRLHRAAVVFSVFALFFPLDVRAAEVATLAGSGRAGFDDGAAPVASFVMPEGVAAAPDGSLIVADTGAQRIRRVEPSGRVTTVAGSGPLNASGLWVDGGYRDGPAAQARFDEPTAVAVAPDGSIIVADARNHCLRRIANGEVTTFAGVPGKSGSADGDVRDATFGRPMSLAFDAAGTLYVADYFSGVRIINSLGKVSTLANSLLPSTPTTASGIAVQGDGDKPVLYVAFDQGIAVVDLAKNTGQLYRSPWAAADSDARAIFLEGAGTIGESGSASFQIATVGPLRFVFTDPADNSIRFVSENLTAQAVGAPLENAPYTAGDFRDGAGSEVRFRNPTGVASLGAGRFAIADTGNRRIRIVSGIDFRHQTYPAELDRNAAFYRIAYLGTSYVAYDQAWDGSISGTIEDGLRPRWRELGFPREPKAFPIQDLSSLQGNADLIRSYISAGLVQCVVWQINSAQIDLLIAKQPAFNIATDAAEWADRVTSIIESVRDTARAHGVPLIVCINPMPFEVSPIEGAVQRPAYSVPAQTVADYARVGPSLLAAAREANVPVVDVFPAFRETELRATHPALYGTLDWHFSAAGASLVAQAILARLLEDHPWASAPN